MTQDPLIVQLLKNLTFAPGTCFSANKPMLFLGDNKILFRVKHQNSHLEFHQAYWTMEEKNGKGTLSLCYNGDDPTAVLPLSHENFQACREQNFAIRCREIVSQCITPRAVALENALNNIVEYFAYQTQAEWLMITQNGQFEWMKNHAIHTKNIFDQKEQQEKLLQDMKQSYLIRDGGTKIEQCTHIAPKKVWIMSSHQALEHCAQIEEALLALGYPPTISMEYKP